MKKYTSKYKKSAFESYERAPENLRKKDFEILWKESSKAARRLYNFGKRKKFKNIAENARVFFQDELYYSGTGINFNKVLLGASQNNIEDVYTDTEKQIYELRTEKFFKKNGYIEYEYSFDENRKEKKTLDEWFNDYKNDKITKEEMNDIIKTYKEQNPDRDAYYADSDANNEDILESVGFIP